MGPYDPKKDAWSEKTRGVFLSLSLFFLSAIIAESEAQ